MAMILLVGTNEPLLEGLVQLISAAGHRAVTARTSKDAVELAAVEPPLVALVSAHGAADASFLRVPLAPGGALLLYRADDEVANGTTPAPDVQRATMAVLSLPLERQRLIALIQHLDERARTTGRGRQTPPEHRVV